MDLLKYLKLNNAQKQIDRLANKLKNKKVVLYGIGKYYQTIIENYDLSKLNIIAVCDKKFENISNYPSLTYKAITPYELKTYDYDCIVVSLINDIEVIKKIDKEILEGTKNEKKRVFPLINPRWGYILKLFFNKI